MFFAKACLPPVFLDFYLFVGFLGLGLLAGLYKLLRFFTN